MQRSDAAHGCGGLDLSRSAAQERPPAPAERHRRWVITDAAVCIALIVGFGVLFRHALGLNVLDCGNSIGVAALLGLAGVIALGMALMAATSTAAAAALTKQPGTRATAVTSRLGFVRPALAGSSA
jgi:hypothetical protein